LQKRKRYTYGGSPLRVIKINVCDPGPWAFSGVSDGDAALLWRCQALFRFLLEPQNALATLQTLFQLLWELQRAPMGSCNTPGRCFSCVCSHRTLPCRSWTMFQLLLKVMLSDAVSVVSGATERSCDAPRRCFSCFWSHRTLLRRSQTLF